MPQCLANRCRGGFPPREWSRWDSSDIDGQTERSNGAFGKSEIEGRAAMVAASEPGSERVSNARGANESILSESSAASLDPARRGYAPLHSKRIDRRGGQSARSIRSQQTRSFLPNRQMLSPSRQAVDQKTAAGKPINLISARRFFRARALDSRCRLDPGTQRVAPPPRQNVEFVMNTAFLVKTL